MRHTPRNQRATPARGIGTLIGNGWLREQPREAWPQSRWDVRGKSALRKCMFMPVPEELRRLAPQISQAALPPQPRVSRPEPEIVPHRRDPKKDVREFAAYVPGAVDPRVAAQQEHAHHVQNAHKLAQREAQRQAVAAAGATRSRWWEDPIALGSLLILLPPVGLAAVWSSKRYSNDARWALTIMTALTMCLMTAIVIAALAMS